MFKIANLATIVVLSWLTSFSFGQSETQVEYWKANIAASSLKDINERLADESTPHWPVIISSYASERLPEKQKQLALQSVQLGETLLEKMANTFKGESDPEQAELESDVALYSSLASRLRQAGGYGNLLLADSAERLAIFRVSGWLVFHPDDTSEAAKFLPLLNVPAVDVKALLSKLSDQDAEIGKAAAKIQATKQGKNLYETFSLMGIDYEKALNPPAQAAEKLLKESSVVALITRMAATESLVRVNISGAIRFFQKGGTYAELNPRDIRPFESRMGQEAKTFNNPLLQAKEFKESDVLYLIAIHKAPAVRSAFLNIALH